MRTKKAIINTLAGLSYEIVALVCGMILPRLILSAFGSSYNGITASIAQFLSCIVLLRAGISGVTRAALYKPLEDNDYLEISRIIRATEKFMRQVAVIFIIFLIVFACIYPILVKDQFEWLFSASLVMIIGISTFIQYYFGFTYQMVLNADQRQCITSFTQIFTTILNTILACILIKLGAGIHIVKLGSTIVFALNPLIINVYVRKKYHISRDVQPNNIAINQRWDAFAHQVANFINGNTDIMLLTIFSNIREVSVYTVYYLVINGLTRLVRNSIPGVASAFGNMMAKGQYKLMKKNFKIFELVVYSLSTVIFGTALVMIVPFVMIYTNGVKDVNYYRTEFSAIIVIAAFFGCVRIPYQHVVEAAGHYKQTKKGAFIEAILNITISIICVIKFGLVGVSIGTLVAAVFRTVQYAMYLSENIIKRSKRLFVKHIIVSSLTVALIVGTYNTLCHIDITNYYEWSMVASVVCLFAIIITVFMDLLFFRKDFFSLMLKLKSLVRKENFVVYNNNQ